MHTHSGAASFPIVSGAGPWRPFGVQRRQAGTPRAPGAGGQVRQGEMRPAGMLSEQSKPRAWAVPLGLSSCCWWCPGPPCPITFPVLSPKRSPQPGLWEHFPRRASVSPALAGQHSPPRCRAVGAEPPRVRGTPGDAPSSASAPGSCSPARPCCFGPSPCGAARRPSHEQPPLAASLGQEHAAPRPPGPFPGECRVPGQGLPPGSSRRGLRHPASPSLNKGSVSPRCCSSSSRSSSSPFSLSFFLFFF